MAEGAPHHSLSMTIVLKQKVSEHVPSVQESRRGGFAIYLGVLRRLQHPSP